MAFEKSRNLQDSLVNPAAFALPNAASGRTSSAAIDLGADVNKVARFELELSVPALTTVMVPDTKTVTYIVETSTTSNFAAVDQTLMAEVKAGAGGVGVPAFVKRCVVPSNGARYARFGVALGALTTDSSTISATGVVRF